MDEANWDDSDALCQSLHEVANASGVTHEERLRAFMMMLGDILASLDCRDCRAVTRKVIDENLPGMLDHAMQFASKRPSTSKHVH